MRDDKFEIELEERLKGLPGWFGMGDQGQTSVLQTYRRCASYTSALSIIDELLDSGPMRSAPEGFFSGPASGIEQLKIVQYRDEAVDMFVQLVCQRFSDLEYARYVDSVAVQSGAITSRDFHAETGCRGKYSSSRDVAAKAAKMLAWHGARYDDCHLHTSFDSADLTTFSRVARALLSRFSDAGHQLSMQVGRSRGEHSWAIQVEVGRKGVSVENINTALRVDRILAAYRRNQERVADTLLAVPYRVPMILDRRRRTIGECWTVKYVYLTDEVRNDLIYANRESLPGAPWTVRLAIRPVDTGEVRISKGLLRLVRDGDVIINTIDGMEVPMLSATAAPLEVGLDNEYVNDLLPLCASIVTSPGSFIEDVQCCQFPMWRGRYIRTIAEMLPLVRCRAAKLALIHAAGSYCELSRDLLLQALRETGDGQGFVGMRWEICSALEIMADDRMADELIAGDGDASLGSARQMVVLGLAKLTYERVLPVLIRLLDDDHVGMHAAFALNRMGLRQSRSNLQRLAKLAESDLQAIAGVLTLSRGKNHDLPPVRGVLRDVPMARGLAEFSVACSLSHLDRILDPLRIIVTEGFGEDEVERLLGSVRDNLHWTTLRFDFDAVYQGSRVPFLVKLVQYYSGAELYVYSLPALIEEYEREIVNVIDRLEGE
ncbi:MAG: HEAT repeat domain-containing protein [Capsulimonadaceae bacterium]